MKIEKTVKDIAAVMALVLLTAAIMMGGSSRLINNYAGQWSEKNFMIGGIK